MKKTIYLTGQWQFKEYPIKARRARDIGDDNWAQCNIPATIFTNLIESGQLDEADFLSNPEKHEHISEKPWLFQKDFNCSDEILNADKTEIIFDGLDTFSNIWLNEKLIAKTNNMFIAHRIDITEHLKSGNNTLMVKFDSAVDNANRLEKRYGKLFNDQLGHSYRVYVRKAQSQFGWDFAPPLIGCGIFRDVRIEATDNAKIENLHIRTVDCSETFADVRVSITLDKAIAAEYLCKLTITCPNGSHVATCDLNFHRRDDFLSAVLNIENPQLWFPNGYGKQPIYKVNAQLLKDGQIIDEHSQTFGIRIIKLNRQKDNIGESFTFEVNNTEIYCKGANWVSNLTLKKTDSVKLLNDAADANMNMLRVWGGGCYEDEKFYDTCDSLGILIFHDFMFACAYYPDRGFFTDQIKIEATKAIKRLRNHPCIAIWCGNNEIHWQHKAGFLGSGKKFYGKDIYNKILPQLLTEYDPDRDYINSSPFGQEKDPNNPSTGTTHNWNVWSSLKPSDEYIQKKNLTPRFVTEFGFQSLPARKTLNSFISDKRTDNIACAAIEKHNYQINGTQRLNYYISENFKVPESINDYIYASQITQARAVKKYAQHLRANSELNSGLMFWQLNDVFTAISWSAIDFKGRKKALYYYAKRFYQPITIIPQANFAENIRKHEHLTELSACISNQSSEPISAMINCTLMNLDFETIDNFSRPISISPNQNLNIILPNSFLQPKTPENCYINFELKNDVDCLADNSYFYLPDKYIDWPQSEITLTTEKITSKRWLLDLTATKMARDIYIDCDFEAELSDNFFDILTKSKKSVIIDCSEDLDNIKNKIKITTLNQKLLSSEPRQ